MEKLSSDQFSYEITPEPTGGTTITLTYHATGETKKFFSAVASPEALLNHMNSLTDELCEQWFKSKKQKRNK